MRYEVGFISQEMAFFLREVLTSMRPLLATVWRELYISTRHKGEVRFISWTPWVYTRTLDTSLAFAWSHSRWILTSMPTRENYIHSLYIVSIDSRAYLSTYTLAFFKEVKRPGHEADHSSPFSVKVSNSWNICSSLCPYGTVFNWEETNLLVKFFYINFSLYQF
jgi:hypothetical protein